MDFVPTIRLIGSQVSTETGVINSVDLECVVTTKNFPDATGRSIVTVPLKENPVLDPATITKTKLIDLAAKSDPAAIDQLKQDAIANFPATTPFMPKDE